MAQKIKGYTPIQVPVGNDVGRQALRNQMQQVSPITTKAINSLSQLAGFSDNANGADNGLQAYKQQQQNRFNQEIVPGILQRFGGQRGSGLNNSLASASQGLGENLAARREDMQMNALQQLLGLNSQLMNTKDYEHGFLQDPESGWSQFASKGLPAIASIVSDIMPSSWATNLIKGFGQIGGQLGNKSANANSSYSQQFGLPKQGYIY